MTSEIWVLLHPQPRSQGPFSTSRSRERTLGTRLLHPLLFNADLGAPSCGLRKTGSVDCYLINDFPVGRQQATECKLPRANLRRNEQNACTT